MPTSTNPSASATGTEGLTVPSEGSKFKRFLKRFGRRPSDDAVNPPEGDENGVVNSATIVREDGTTTTPTAAAAATTSTATTTGGGVGGVGVGCNGAGGSGTATGSSGKKSTSIRSRRGSKSKVTAANQGGSNAASGDGQVGTAQSTGGHPKKRGFFQSSSNVPPLPSQRPPKQSQRVSSGLPSAAAGASREVTTDFGGSSGEGLANTLTLPTGSSSPPQLGGLPSHDPIATTDLIPNQGIGIDGVAPLASPSMVTPSSSSFHAQKLNHPSPSAQNTPSGGAATGLGDSDASSLSRSRGASTSFEMDSSDGHRDSIDNRTMDTGKSRASTKPTTLMSLETRDAGGVNPAMAHIAQHRHGDGTTASPRVASLRGDGASIHNNVNGINTSAIQFATPPLGRSASGTIVQLPNQNETTDESNYMNVPSLSRHHPSNNPQPHGIPGDDASMLTLASSTAAASIGGGGASSRGHSHHATRSIGGSLMGERRNSSDTYASVKAIPPLSRRGSDSSTRTGRSVAASATGRNSAQAMTSFSGTPGPGAPSDRIGIQRSPSQKTVATQLSVPVSSPSTQALAAGSGGPAAINATSTTPLATSTTMTSPSIPGSDQQSHQNHSNDSSANVSMGESNKDVREVPSIVKTSVSENEPNPSSPTFNVEDSMSVEGSEKVQEHAERLAAET